MKIYIIGSTGSGKTTLARHLSKKYKIKYYELDLLVYDDEHGHRKRSDKEISTLFDKILENDSWIIEDVGRKKFIKGREQCDQIYYLKLPKIEVIKRVIKRWFKQKLRLEKYNYPPTFKNLIDMIKITWNYFKKEPQKILSLETYKDKVIFLDKKKIKDIKENK